MTPKKESMADAIEVQATGPVRHGNVGEAATEYVAGDTFTVTRKQAIELHAAGAIEEPGAKRGKSQADKDAEEKAAAEAAITAANEKAAAEAAGKQK